MHYRRERIRFEVNQANLGETLGSNKMLENPEGNVMKIENYELSLLAVMLCDYAEIEGICITPPELELIINIVREAKLPQNTVEHLWRIHAQAVATLEG